MKKLVLLFIAVATLARCSKSDNDKNEPESPYKNTIVASWLLIHYDGDPVSSDLKQLTVINRITFRADGSYSEDGQFGYSSGIYTLSGNTVKTYVDGKLYATYEITSLKDDIVEAKMTNSLRSVTIKFKKME